MAKLTTKFEEDAVSRAMLGAEEPDWIRSYSDDFSHYFGVCPGEAPAIVAWMETRDRLTREVRRTLAFCRASDIDNPATRDLRAALTAAVPKESDVDKA